MHVEQRLHTASRHTLSHHQARVHSLSRAFLLAIPDTATWPWKSTRKALGHVLRRPSHPTACATRVQARPDDGEEGLAAADLEEMEAKKQQLSTERRHRDPNLPGLATTGDLDSLAQAAAQPLHSPSQPGVLALALQPSGSPQEEPKLAATGTSPP